MIDGPGQIHWCTFFDIDGDPYGETCRCSVGEDHFEDDLPSGTKAVAADAVLSFELPDRKLADEEGYFGV